MKEELQLKLFKKYPKILKDFRGDPKQTCMAWGLEVEDGWYALLDECLEKLQHFCDLCSTNEKTVQVVSHQIKEKFGDLRFYYGVHGSSDVEAKIVDDIITAAERKSRNTCEITGEEGCLCKRGGWYKTLCRTEARTLGYVAVNQETEQYWKTKDAEPSNS